jgi:hypothetical protein
MAERARMDEVEAEEKRRSYPATAAALEAAV